MTGWLHTYRGRLVVLTTLGALLVAVVWTKRLARTVEQWRTNAALEAGMANGDQDAEHMTAIRAELEALNHEFGELSEPAEVVWQRVLSLIGQASANGSVQLHGVESESVGIAADNSLHILPITVAGPYPSLLRLANDLQRAVPEAHAISLRFHTDHATYGKASSLLMTVYLQKIIRHE